MTGNQMMAAALGVAVVPAASGLAGLGPGQASLGRAPGMHRSELLCGTLVKVFACSWQMQGL